MSRGVKSMQPSFVHPHSGERLRRSGKFLVADSGARFPIVNGVPRFCELENYASSFGTQWSKFRLTQLDRHGVSSEPSRARLFAETAWTPDQLAGLDILEVGSGAGRFSRVILEGTRANLFSVDYSSAVDANWRNNCEIAGDRFELSQASVYELPYPDNRFDKVFCLGVLQHTPDFERSVRSLVRKVKPGGEIVVDFYEIRGPWTKIHAKYLLRPFTKRMSQERLLRLIDRHAGRLIRISRFLQRNRLGILRRFLPVVDVYGALPAGLSDEELREWVVLDTFDMFSPAYDNPQRVTAVAKMFERSGATVTFAGNMECGSGKVAVVRAVKQHSRA